MENLFIERTIQASNVFDHDFIDPKMLYLYHFNRLPHLSSISTVDSEKALKAFRQNFAEEIVEEYHYNDASGTKGKLLLEQCILVLRNKAILFFGSWYISFYYADSADPRASLFIEHAGRFRERSKRQPLEINLIVHDTNGLTLRSMEIKRVKLDLDLFYPDDFLEVDKLIRTRLNKKKDRGIVLLHGLPGTGKTSYLRYLIGKLRKRVLFLSPTVAGNLMDPSFVELMINNPDTVLIIEDAENIIMDRRQQHSDSVSNLLNMSDGLLADFLNVQIICTFNSSLTTVDSALLREGRLIARYEFGKLSIEKAQRLSDHLGLRRSIDRPLTVAEISNPAKKSKTEIRNPQIGFRSAVLNN